MRLQRYLNEKFFDGYGNDYYVEIFKNPSGGSKISGEMRDVESDNGYRVFIDMKKKNVFFATSEVYHNDMLKRSPKLARELGLDWQKYWDGDDKSIGYIIMGDCDGSMKHFNSDALNSLAGYDMQSALPYLKELANRDFKWLSKYGFNPKEVIDSVLNAIGEIS